MQNALRRLPMTRSLFLRTLAVITVAAVLAAAAAKPPAIAIFKAQMLTGKAPVEPPLIKIQIEIKSWTTPDEVRAFQQALNNAGVDAFMDAFSKTDKGVVRFMYARGFNIIIHAAFTIPTEKGKKILLFTNNQQWDPGYQKSKTRNLFAAIELKLNEKNKGEGRFYEDAQIRLEPQEGTIVVESYDGTPKLFPQVQEIIKKAEEKK
jgi:hypothetical protein